MSLFNSRRERLLREALGEDQHLPSVTRTSWTVGVIVAVIAIIALTGIALPERERSYTPPPSKLTIGPPITNWPAPNVKESASNAETGNVVDYTF